MPNESTGDSGPMDPEGTRAGRGRLLARRYRLGKPVGHGGMGTVWQAHDEVLGRDVAVKEVILPHGLSDDERAIQYKRTFREARTAARLGHPGVVTVYDVVEEAGRPWIIMELVRSRSLDQVIKQEGLLPPGRAARIARQMLAALHAAHEAGVLHRDVKPSNVLVGSGDRTVLTDFGIATATGDVTLTQTGLVMGSPAYIAPERARGRTVGPPSDLWSLGITIYAMVDGKSPYDRPEAMASLVAIISEEPEPAVNAGPLTPVVEGLLRKDPDERMNAHEAGRLLDEIVRADARQAQRTRPIPRPSDEALAGAGAEAPGGPAPSESPAAVPEPPGTEDGGAEGAGAGPTIGTGSAGSAAAGPAGPQGPGSRPRGSRRPVGRRSEGQRPEGQRQAEEHSAAAEAAGVVRDDAPSAGTSAIPGTSTGTAAVDPGSDADPTLASGRSGPGPAGGSWFLGMRVTTTTVILAIVLVALLVLGIVAVQALSPGHGAAPRSRTSPAGGTPGPGGGRSSTSQATPTSYRPSDVKTPAASGVPAGFKTHRDPSGFAIAIPKDWKGPEKRDSSSSSVFYTAPDGAFIQVDQTRRPNKSALEDWQKLSKNGSNLYSGYKKIKVEAVTEGAPLTDPTGRKIADWEFTHGSAPTHVLNRGFIMNGRGYAILLSAPDRDWKSTFERLAPV
ncbi:MAG TPA: serine/threonine-protein kinase, partial [Actinomadura sp.]|nr:serine/threonine-protein kinase [Actinomadura sp.]